MGAHCDELIAAACNFAQIIGEDDLPQQERRYLHFREVFEKEFLCQDTHEARDVDVRLDLALRELSAAEGGTDARDAGENRRPLRRR
jgi:vacuolar-type H+-ATPase subunit B/Vma2